MSETEIIDQIRRLPEAQRHDLAERIWLEFGEPDDLTSEQIAELERRAEELRKNPQDGIPWEQVHDEVRKRFGWK